MHRPARARRLRHSAVRGRGVACCCSFRHPERRVEGPGRLAARTPVACSSSHRPRRCLDYARHDYVFDPSDQRVVRRDGHAVEFRDLRGDVRIALRAHAGFGFRRSEGEGLHAVAPFVIPSVESRDLGGWRRARLWLAHRATAPAGASTTLGMTMFSILPISVSFGAMVTPSNFVICAATYASPCARTPASASGDPRVRDCMLLLLSSSRASSRGTWAVGGAHACGLLIEPPPPQVPRLCWA